MLSLNHSGWIIFREQALFVEYRELSVKAIQRVKGLEADVAVMAREGQSKEEIAATLGKSRDFVEMITRTCAGCVKTIKIAPLTEEREGASVRDRLPTKRRLKPLELEYEDSEGTIKQAVFSDLSAEDKIEALLSYGGIIGQIVSLVRHDDEAVLLGK